MDSITQWDAIEEREGEPCWCPDSFREGHLYVNYCPRHGTDPDPELARCQTWVNGDHDSSLR